MPLEFVTKRNGQQEVVDWSKVDGRLNYLNSHPTQLKCNASFVSDRVRETDGENGMETKILDERAAKVAADLASLDPDYLVLSSRICVSNHHKNTLDCFSSTMEACYRNRKNIEKSKIQRSVAAPRINPKFYKFVQLHKNKLNRMIDYARDYRLTDFGFAAVMDRYLLKRSGPKDKVELRPQDYAIERPQDMYMRVSCAIHMNRSNLADDRVLVKIERTYYLLSMGLIMHATPTVYNCGTCCEQCLSCYLGACDDSIEGIGNMKANFLKLSKYSGGIGWWWPLRSNGSEVSTTNGMSSGPEPFLRGVEADMKAANQGGKRPGSAAYYEQCTHPDIMRIIKLKRSDEVGNVDGLFYGLWIFDEIMRRVERDDWIYFVDPHAQPKLGTLLGAEYTAEYERIIRDGDYVGEPIKAREFFMEVCITQAETGMPYMLYADAVNSKNNMKNSMVTRCSNLCAEITIPSSPVEYGCCAISSLCLSKFVVACDCECEKHRLGCNGTLRVDYDLLADCTGVLVQNLNKITDFNFYPVEEARRSQMRHRPLGIGVQGLADMFHLLKYPFTSKQAKAENKRVFESIYYGGLKASMELAIEDGAYETFLGDPLNNPENPDEPCPAAQGILQFDMWGLKETDLMGYWDWTALKDDIMKYGLRNSLITALPPTASTSQIQGNNEAFEAFTDNIYVRKTLSGENLVINPHLIRDLREQGLYTPAIRAQLVANRGSVRNIPGLPEWIREQYRTVWELDNRDLIDMDADRAPFIDQTQSSNRFMAEPTAKKLFAMHLRCWRKGLKTGMYYLRSQSKSKPTQFSESAKSVVEEKVEEKVDESKLICSLKKGAGIQCYTCQ